MDDSGPIVLERDSLWIFLSILIFYSFGIGFTYSCQSLGLLIVRMFSLKFDELFSQFSWIGVALAIVVTLFIGYLILTIIALGSVFNARNEAYIIGLIIAVIMILLIYVWVKKKMNRFSSVAFQRKRKIIFFLFRLGENIQEKFSSSSIDKIEK